MLLLSLTNSLHNPAEKKKKLLLQHCSLSSVWEFCHLPWARSRLLLMKAEQSCSNLKQRKSNVLLVNFNLCRCIADQESTDLCTCLVGSVVLLGAGWQGRARTPNLWPKAVLGLCRVWVFPLSLWGWYFSSSCELCFRCNQPTTCSPQHTGS